MRYIVSIIILLIVTQQIDARSYHDIQVLSQKLEQKYGIKIYTQSAQKFSWKIEYQFACKQDYQKLYRYLQLFDQEFQKYPKNFIKKTALKGILFVKKLSINGQYRTAIPDYYKEFLIYDFLRGDHHKRYQKHVIHHEYYHMIEQEINKNPYFKDPAWNRLNQKGFKYGHGGASVQHKTNQYSYTHPQKGFVNLYSMSGLEEDKAEMFATLFIKREYQQLKKWGKKDKILHQKELYMKGFLRKLDSGFYKGYWNRLYQKNIK